MFRFLWIGFIGCVIAIGYDRGWWLAFSYLMLGIGLSLSAALLRLAYDIMWPDGFLGDWWRNR